MLTYPNSFSVSLRLHTSLIPKIYCKGKNFTVMKMVYGIDLREYLQKRTRLSSYLTVINV